MTDLWGAARRRMPAPLRGPSGPAGLRARGAAACRGQRPARRDRLDDLDLCSCPPVRLRISRRSASTRTRATPRVPSGELARRSSKVEAGSGPRRTILFKAEASAWTPSAVQLQQVWVEPELRGRGYARRALADLCRPPPREHPLRLPFRPAGERARDRALRSRRHATGLGLLSGSSDHSALESLGWIRRASAADRGRRPPARADPAGRRGRLPRLGRR